jgi:serine protease Do
VAVVARRLLWLRLPAQISLADANPAMSALCGFTGEISRDGGTDAAIAQCARAASRRHTSSALGLASDSLAWPNRVNYKAKICFLYVAAMIEGKFEADIAKGETVPMNDNTIKDIVIRHLTGSKANLVEHIELEGVTEITVGRDPASKIAFDSTRDDVVSRRHGIIRVVGGTQISFRLTDIGSNNGTFLNGKQITEPVELLPEDVIELGKNGPKFVFDVQPRPPYLVARTRVIDLTDANVTRVIKSAEIANEAAAQDVIPKPPSGAESAPVAFEPPPPPKPDISRDTVMRLLGEERRERGKAHESASRVWMYSLSGLALLVALAGGGFYWRHVHDQNLARAELQRAKDELTKREDIKLQQQQAEHEKELAELRQMQAEEEKKAGEEQKKIAEGLGLSAQQIADKYGNATAQIDRAWRLYDQTTGRPVFHETRVDYVPIGNGKKEQKTLPAYILLPNGAVVRWLTLEDDQRSNIPIGGEASGTGFAVSENGFMLTNKHVAAPWNLRFGPSDSAMNGYKYGFLYKYYRPDPKKKTKRPRAELVDVIDLQNDDRASDLWNWVPASGGIIFHKDIPIVIGEENNIPDPSKSGNRTFFGRNDRLDVQFANSRGHTSATLVNFSNYSDAALIKVDTPQQLKKLDIASDDTVTVGEPVVAIGFPAVATEVEAKSTTYENYQRREITDVVPQPFVSEGIVQVISPAVKTENGVTYGGKSGDVIQMSINSTGAGNSGGPVFNKKGVVVGLFTYTRKKGGADTSMAVPIKYGRDLLMSQHP